MSRWTFSFHNTKMYCLVFQRIWSILIWMAKARLTVTRSDVKQYSTDQTFNSKRLIRVISIRKRNDLICLMLKILSFVNRKVIESIMQSVKSSKVQSPWWVAKTASSHLRYPTLSSSPTILRFSLPPLHFALHGAGCTMTSNLRPQIIETRLSADSRHPCLAILASSSSLSSLGPADLAFSSYSLRRRKGEWGKSADREDAFSSACLL